MLTNDTPAILYLTKKDKLLAKIINEIGPLLYSPPLDYFAFLVQEIIEQMLSKKTGQLIYQHLLDICSGEITPQKIYSFSDNELKGIGTSTSKVNYLKALSKAVINNQLILTELPNLPNEDIIKKLTAIEGIGVWTAKMFLLFALNRPDILPFEDAAFLQAYKWLYNTSDVNVVSIEKKCKKWKPYSSYAARYLYKALDLGLTKNKFHLYK